MTEVKPVLPRVTAPELMPEPNEETQTAQNNNNSKGILSTVKDNKLMLVIIALVIIIVVILAYVVYKKPDKKNAPNVNSGKPPPSQPTQAPPQQPPAQPLRATSQEEPVGLSQHENLVRSINERRRRNPTPVNPNDRLKDYVSEDHGQEEHNIPVKNDEEEIKDYNEE